MNWDFSATIAVIGDHNVDIDYVGTYPGLMSREQESLAVFESSPESVRYSGGGAANIVETLADIQVTALPVGVWDWSGSILRSVRSGILSNIFHSKGISDKGLVHGATVPAFIKYYRPSGVHVFRANIASEPISAEVEDRLVGMIEKLDGIADLVIVADYDETGNGVITKSVLEAIYYLSCPKIGLSRERADRLYGYDYLILNQMEIRKATKGRAIDSIKQYADELWNIVSPKNIIITLEGEGAVWYTKETDNPFFQETMIDSVPLTTQIDTCGCGDAFVALFAACIARGDDVEQAIKAGNAAGRAQARKLCGAHNITIDEVKREWQEVYDNEVV